MSSTFVPETEKRAIFDVPLSTQRYIWVQTFLRNNESLKSITDFGCGNGRFIFWLKNVANLEKINFVDCDQDTIEYNLEGNFQPNLMEMMFGRQNSTNPLEVCVYHGDVTLPDDRLHADVFSLIEVVEHLPPKQVELACRTIYGYYKPRFVLITTPNREFNHLLSRDESNRNQFRHYDHKFEWTRTQFQQWAQNICRQYPFYRVEYDGVGHLEGKSEQYGPCTQIAIFVRQDDIPFETDNVADLICCDYLFDKLQMTEECQGDRNGNSNQAEPKPVECKLMSTYTMPGKKIHEQTDDIRQNQDCSAVDSDMTTSSDEPTDPSP